MTPESVWTALAFIGWGMFLLAVIAARRAYKVGFHDGCKRVSVRLARLLNGPEEAQFVAQRLLDLSNEDDRGRPN